MSLKSNKKEPHIFETLRRDIQHGNFWDTLRRESRELRAFYISDDQRERLGRMPWYRRMFFVSVWILKSMFYHLTPTRRLLLVVGMLLLWAETNVVWEDGSIRFNLGAIGGLAFFFVLLLELKDKLLAHDELAAGRTIQNALLPPRSPQLDGWSLWLYTKAANEVGGDLVDFLRMDGHRHVVLMADMAGKGLRAALLTAKLQATIRALAADHPDPAVLCAKVNTIFHRDGLPNMFSSLLLLALEPAGNQIRFVNAGHLPPFLLSPDGIRELPKGEPAIGLTRRMNYTTQTCSLGSGETFFAYSDGLTEACNPAGEFYGPERLHAVLNRTRTMPASVIGETVLAEIDRFTSEARANDDLSLLIVRRP